MNGLRYFEKSDGLAIVVSEETGAISIAENGSLARYLDTKLWSKY